MNKIKTLYVFIVNQNGEEKIVTWPDKSGINVPLVYLDQEEIERDKMRLAMQEMADLQKLYFELREYQLVKKNTEMFYPARQNYNA